jgi:hypothetical protein
MTLTLDALKYVLAIDTVHHTRIYLPRLTHHV